MVWRALIFIIILILIIVFFEWLSGRFKKPPRVSRGHQAVRDALQRKGLKFQEEVPVTINGKRYRFDFKIENGPWIEFDGRQHFEMISHFHRNPGDFTRQQGNDRNKTRWVLDRGQKLIRIDHTQISKISEHLEQGLKTTGAYLSSPSMYSYLGTSVQ